MARQETTISTKVFVGNLSFDVTREELIEAFAVAGRVLDAKVPTDRETGRPRGFAFVEFDTEEAAQKSIELLNGRDLKGRPLRVNEAENRPPRPAGAGFGARPPASPRPGAFRSGSPPPPFMPAAPDFEIREEGRGRRFRQKSSKGRNPRRRRRDDVIDDDDY